MEEVFKNVQRRRFIKRAQTVTTVKRFFENSDVEVLSKRMSLLCPVSAYGDLRKYGIVGSNLACSTALRALLN